MATLQTRQVSNLFAIAADHCGVTPKVLLSPDRSIRLAHARWAVMLTLRAMGWSHPRIGRALSRDSSTSMHGVRQARMLRSSDGDFVELLFKLERNALLAAPTLDRPKAAPAYFPYAHRTMAEVMTEELQAA